MMFNHLKYNIMTTQTKIALGILGAVTTGVIIGLLIAPDKGSEVRKLIKNKAGSLGDSLGQLLSKSGLGKKTMSVGKDVPAY
jgi:gas vesicle protein